YLGGSSDDVGYAIDVDAAGNAFVGGRSFSTNFPTTAGVFQAARAGGAGNVNGFVTEGNAAGTGLVYSTYLGGTTGTQIFDLALDSAGNAYVGGLDLGNFPVTAGSFQTAFGGGTTDGFVAKLSPGGTSLLFGSYVGGSGDEFIFGVTVDSA